MIKKTITYTDYNGDERTEDFYFNLNKAELMELELGEVGGFTELVKKAMSLQDGPKLVKIFKDLVLMSYGVKSADGRRFIKTQELRDEFTQTEAYSTIFMELATDDKKGAEFVNGVIPADISEELQKENRANHPALKN